MQSNEWVFDNDGQTELTTYKNHKIKLDYIGERKYAIYVDGVLHGTSNDSDYLVAVTFKQIDKQC